ncbi:MAG: OB-fold nucleic acid binding domain-containing protein, partial [Armatimonadota bacterium]|nr:OB-fold nucleic acid binding domain-containing protein [Armatimonadota bacterium]
MADEQPQTDELIEQRLEKLRALRQRGMDPFAVERFDRTHTAQEVIDQFERLHPSGQPVAVCGRVVGLRVMGKAAFMHLLDASGRIQVYFKRDVVGSDAFELISLIDIGDFLGASGPVFRTRTGEITVQV